MSNTTTNPTTNPTTNIMEGINMDEMFAQFVAFMAAQAQDGNTQAQAQGKGKGNTQAQGKGKGNTQAQGKGKGNTQAQGKGKGNGSAYALGMDFMSQELSDACKPETYTLSSNRDNHPITIATNLVACCDSGNSSNALVNTLSNAIARGNKARNAGDYVVAAETAFAARHMAECAMGTPTADNFFIVSHNLALTYLSIAAELSGLNAVLDTWVASRGNDIASARVERSSLKAKNMRIVVTRKAEGKRPIYLSVNTTSSMDVRKIDRAYNQRLINQAKKSAEKAFEK